MKMRWFIEYGQLIGRLVSVEIPKNIYKAGEGLEGKAAITTLNGKDKSGVLEISVRGKSVQRTDRRV